MRGVPKTMLTDRLEALSRRFLGNRRRHQRQRQDYDTLVTNEKEEIVLRGRARDISQSGTRIRGLEVGPGLELGQRVCIEFLLLPKSLDALAEKAKIWGHVCRIDPAKTGALDVAVSFERFLPA